MATRPHTVLDPLADRLRQVHTIPALVQYLHDELNWPVNVDSWEDNLFDWQPDELNLKVEHEVKVKSIKQLRPLVSGQPWGIFFVEFNKGRLPITVLRRVLNGLVPKGRAASGGHQTWAAHDLLFVSSFGESNAREIALAHFTDESSQGDLPTLRVLGWDDDDTPMQLGYVAQTLRDKLRWPAHTRGAKDLADWRAQWSSAFALGYRQEINDAKTLALAMAELAKRIRRRVNTVLALESDSGHLRQMHKAFKDNLIAALSEDAFADMFAQTITYGLFTARASRSSGALVADNLADMVPSTNPFLKELLGSFLSAAGRARSSAKRVDFDELGINEVVTVLREVPMDAVLRSFNASKPGDDPVIHFYEDFLKAYDKAMRAKRGVFYTPSPVVQFIVRSVDEILKTEFGIEDGLASTITWGEMIARKPELTLPKFCTADTPFVQVLDPATGTGTFIVEVITQIHAHMLAKWAKQGKVTKAQLQPLWVDYVKHHLLPRLYAFELMMAPYAIAHMKIGLKLFETGYTFPDGGPRVNVFLTNALEPAHEIYPGLAFEAPMLAHEAAAANRVKAQLAATVVVGNPPYSGDSGNQGDWITRLMRERLDDGADSFFRFNDADLGERNPKWVNNDYVKFFRLAQSRLATMGTGVLGYITSNSYLESPTFRGVRQSLLHTLPHLRIVDLHGNSKRGETAGGDENVFEITEGVAIAVGNLLPGLAQLVTHADLAGPRLAKYDTLMAKGLQLLAPLTPSGERLQLVRSDTSDITEYERGWPLPTIAPVNSVGIVTARDALCIQFTEKEAWDTVRDFAQRDAEDARQVYALGEDARDWQVELAQSDLQASGPHKKHLQPILYRPFDIRQTYYTGQTRGFLCRPRPEVMRHMLAGSNFGIVCCRQMSQMDEEWSLVGSTRLPIESCTISNKTKEINYLFPLWRYHESKKTANLSPSFAVALQSALNAAPTDYRPEDPTAPLHAEKIFHYLYAAMHSPAYRRRYAAFLRTDFPRIPIPGSRKVFDALAKLGAELVAWHLLEHPDAVAIDASHTAPSSEVTWFGRDFTLNKVAEKSRELADVQGTDDKVGKVFINPTSGFANVHQSIWQHTIGGYQVLTSGCTTDTRRAAA
jgi:predicted helicase